MNDLIVDFAHGDIESKRAFLRQHADKKVVMDLSCVDPQILYKEFPQLVGSFPGQFAMQGKVELHLREEVPGVTVALAAQGLTGVRTELVGLGFVVPRTTAMIVNEAYFALGEKVASATDIDRAMRFGVNYPDGPFAWSRGREALFVELLEALLKSTGDERYQVAPLLTQSFAAGLTPCF